MGEFQAVPFQHDGTELVGQLIAPDGRGPHPGVLVMHTAHGLSPMMRERAQRLADLGYVALATDMYGGGQYFGTGDEAGAPFMALQQDPHRLRSRVVGWHETLAARPEVDPARTAAIGFCFGGQCVLELARSGADARVVVSYHGLLKTAEPAQARQVKAQVAIYAGANDPYAPPEDVAAVQREFIEAKADWTLTVFGTAAHAFTDPNAGEMGMPGIEYNAAADRQSWAGTVALLDAVLAPTAVEPAATS